MKAAFKITALDAVIRSKLLYGLDSAQLTPSQQRRTEVFQLTGLRKILKMNTTYVERNNSKDQVYRRANELIKHETPDGKTRKRVKSFVTCYKNSRMNRLSRICRMPSNHPVRHIAFAPPPREHIAMDSTESQSWKTEI